MQKGHKATRVKAKRAKRRNSSVVFDAIQYAARAHAGQYRKGADKVPYIVHPLGVGKILIEYGMPDHIVVAGILHDTIEDTHVTLNQIRKKYGATVAELVAGASEPNREDAWEDRKRHTIEHLKRAPIELLYVTCADKLDNVRAMVKDFERHGEKIFERFNQPKAKQKWYYTSLARVFVLRAKTRTDLEIFGEYEREVRKIFGKY